MFFRDIDKAIQLYHQAVKLGGISALYGLGNIYKEGMGGIEINANKAKDFYSQAAAKSHSIALAKLGMMSYLEDGIKVDMPTAANCFLALEELNFSASTTCNILGSMYCEGRGDLPVDRDKGVRLIMESEKMSKKFSEVLNFFKRH